MRLPLQSRSCWHKPCSRFRRYKTVVRSINSGVLLVRPCAAVEAHMLRVLGQNPKLRFTHAIAEQDFLAWWVSSPCWLSLLVLSDQGFCVPACLVAACLPRCMPAGPGWQSAYAQRRC